MLDQKLSPTEDGIIKTIHNNMEDHNQQINELQDQIDEAMNILEANGNINEVKVELKAHIDE